MNERERASIVQQRRRHSETAIENWSLIRNHAVSRNQSKVRIVRGKYLCLVTGAGNGLGRALANLAFQDQGIFPLAMSGSKVILVDCDEEGLKETSGKKMRQFLKHRKIDVELIVKDLSDLKEARELMEIITKTYDKDFEHVIFLNHATTLGDVTKTLLQYNDPTDFQKYAQLNITSRMFLTTEFCRIFPNSKQTVVHTFRFDMTSPKSHLGLTYIATNAMNAFGETLAKENPALRVIHYTASMIETNKTKTLLENCGNDEIKEEIATFYSESKLHTPLDAAKRLTRLLEGGKFTKGEVLSVKDKDMYEQLQNGQ